MKFGLSLPTYAPLGSPQAIVELAEGAERVGLASLWTMERLLRPVAPVSPGHGVPAAVLPPLYASVYDPLETLSYVAARTSRIRLGTSVLDALFHPPVVLARRIATLDQLSGGRLDIGLGQGLIPQEFEAAGIPMSRRGNGYEEHIAAMRAVWAADPVRFDGRFYQIAESQIGPKPVQPGGPPLLGGAAFPAGIERIARMGLGFNVSVNSPDLADLGDAIAMFRQAAQNAGRDPGTLPVVVRVNGSVTVKPPAGERAPLTGSVTQVADDLATLHALDVDQVFWQMDTEPADQLEALEQLLAQVESR
ncbi:LLM class flavin-dependent oxidoreductase [Jiangella muralis]|uniref:LLM class flavin-dependent oxidoreductase n=1 Tax=Jiangella muralis TaxID=702383 RepID=UPI00069E1D7C|nr:TIGR03619 family F420-dependent LLM class oxidoreductase [Jiangella muralis]